jgi:undecaprenyl-diphosphatase
MNELDVSVFRWVHGALTGAWTLPMAALSLLGGGWGSLALLPMLARARTRSFGRSLAIVLGVTAVLVFALKRLVGRSRPCACLEDVRALVFAAPTDFSFPSGHAAGSFAFAVFVGIVLVGEARDGQRLARALGAAALLALASGVALSRVALGVHFPADVAAGAVLGTVVAAVGARLHRGAAARRAISVQRSAFSSEVRRCRADR